MADPDKSNQENMVAITPKDLADIAYLARLDIPKNQEQKLIDDLDGILDFVDQMKKVDTQDVEPLGNPLEAEQRLRPDKITEENQRNAFQKIAPATENGLYLVPKVIE